MVPRHLFTRQNEANRGIDLVTCCVLCNSLNGNWHPLQPDDPAWHSRETFIDAARATLKKLRTNHAKNTSVLWERGPPFPVGELALCSETGNRIRPRRSFEIATRRSGFRAGCFDQPSARGRAAVHRRLGTQFVGSRFAHQKRCRTPRPAPVIRECRRAQTLGQGVRPPRTSIGMRAHSRERG